MPTMWTSSVILWAAKDLRFNRELKAASVSLGMFLFTSEPNACVRLVNGHWSLHPTFPFQKLWEAVLRLRISVHEQLMFCFSLPLEQACRIQNLTPSDPASWYANQLFRCCKYPEASGSLSHEALFMNILGSCEEGVEGYNTESFILWELSFPAGFELMLFGVLDGTLKSNTLWKMLQWTPCKD